MHKPNSLKCRLTLSTLIGIFQGEQGGSSASNSETQAGDKHVGFEYSSSPKERDLLTSDSPPNDGQPTVSDTGLSGTGSPCSEINFSDDKLGLSKLLLLLGPD